MPDSVSPSHSAFLQEVRVFLQDRVYPLEPLLLQDGFGAVKPHLDALRPDVKQRGWFTPQMPAEVGGMGLSLIAFGHLSEVLGTTPLGHYVFNCQAPDAGNMEILHRYGSPDQHQQFLAPLVQGTVRSCFAMTEPDQAGSNPVWLHTTAVRRGDTYHLNGHKWFTTGFDGAAFVIVMAVTHPEAPRRHERASMILVPTNTPGLVHVRKIKLMGEAGEDHHSHSEIRFDDCQIPASACLGPPGKGFMIAQERLGPGRIHHCMRWLGICQRSFDLLCQRIVHRELAPGEPLAFQHTIQHEIAELKALQHAARLMVLDTAARIEEVGSKAARTEISMIKYFVADVLLRVLDRTIQVHGALGMTDDLLPAFWYRHERGARIYDGTDEVHKSVVARHILRDYGLQLPRTA